MMRPVLIACSLVLTVICLTCCSDSSSPSYKDFEIRGVHRIFMHEQGHYSIMVEDEDVPGRTKVTNLNIRGWALKECYFYEDVAPEERMWVKVSVHPTRGYKTALHFHIHSPQDVAGGGWDHGKFGSGQTDVVE